MSGGNGESFEPPWAGGHRRDRRSRDSCPEGRATTDEVVCRLELLLRRREQLSCPSDDVDVRILTAVRRALDGVKSAAGRRDVLMARQNRLLVREAKDVIEKTLKTRT